MQLPIGELVATLKGQDDGFMEMIDQATAGIKGIMAAVISFEVVSVRAWGNFDEAMTHSTALIGDLTGSIHDDMEQMALDLSTTTTSSANDLAKAYTTLHQAGFNAESMARALQQTNSFSVATNSELKESTRELSDALFTLGFNSKDATVQLNNLKGLSNELIQAEMEGGGSALQMAHALGGRLGLEMRGLGIHTEEAIAILTSFNKKGVETEEGAQMLARIINALQRNVAQHGDAWRAAGVDVMDFHGNLLPMADIIHNMTERMKGMSDVQRRTFLESLGFQDRFTDSQILAVQALGGTSEAIKEMQSRLHGLGDTANEVANVQMETLNARLDVLSNKFQNVKIETGSMLGGAVLEVVEYLNNSLYLLDTVLDKIKSVTTYGLTLVVRALLDTFTGGLASLMRVIDWFTTTAHDGLTGEITTPELDRNGRPGDPLTKAKAAKERSFETISLRRFDLGALAHASKQSVQEVGDRTTHKKLDRIADIFGRTNARIG